MTLALITGGSGLVGSNLTRALLDDGYKVRCLDFDKDHRACMMSFIAALTLGGKWIIHDTDSIKTSFPNFVKILKNLGAKIN